MPAQVDPVAVEVDSARDSTDRVRRLDDDGLDIGPPKQLQRGGQSRGPGADNDGGRVRCHGSRVACYRGLTRDQRIASRSTEPVTNRRRRVRLDRDVKPKGDLVSQQFEMEVVLR